MVDSPGPCVKASTHSPIHPFFYLSSYLLSHPSIAPSAHISTQRLPFLSSTSLNLSSHIIPFSSSSSLSVIHMPLSNNSASLIFPFSHIICSFAKVTDQAKWVYTQGPLTTGTLASVHLQVRPLVVRDVLVQRWISQLSAVCVHLKIWVKNLKQHTMKWAVLKLFMDHESINKYAWHKSDHFESRRLNWGTVKSKIRKEGGNQKHIWKKWKLRGRNYLAYYI